jgi:N-acetylneuraminic acid mutarotase
MAAQRTVLSFDPQNRRVKRIAELPRPLTHAAGVSLGGRFYVIGGRGDLLDSASAAVQEIEPATGRVRAAGRLPTALSDAGAASVPGGIVVVGGRDSAGRVHDEILRTGRL